MGRDDIFKRISGNESLNRNSNGNDVRIIDFAASNNVFFKSTIFPHLKHS